MGSTPRGSEVGNCSEHFLDREKYFWRGRLPVVVEHGFHPSGSEVGNCSEHFLDREKYFWRGGLPVVVEHGFHPRGSEIGRIVVNIFWTEKNIFLGEANCRRESVFPSSAIGSAWNHKGYFSQRHPEGKNLLVAR